MSNNHNLKKSFKSLKKCKTRKCSNINKNNKVETGKCITKHCNKQIKQFQLDFSNSLRLIADEMKKAGLNKNTSPKKSSRRNRRNSKGSRKARKARK